MDFFSGLEGFLGGPPQQNNPQYSWQPPPPPTGLLGNLDERKFQILGALAGGLKPGGSAADVLMGVIEGGKNDVANASRLDALKQHREQQGAAGALIDKFQGLTPEQKRFFAANPKAWEELSKTMVTPPTTTIGNTALQTSPFGGARPVFREPQKPELVEGYDVASGRMKKGYIQPPEPFGGYGTPGNMVVPGKTPGTSAPGTFFSQPSAQETSEGRKSGETFGTEYEDIRKKSAAATSSLATLNRMKQLSPDAFQGAAAPGQQFARSLLTSFGIPSKTVAAGEELTALTNKLVLDAAGGTLGTGFSNADTTFMSNMNPTLAQSALGRSQIIDALVKVKEREQKIAGLAYEWKKSTGSMDGFQSYLAKWAEENPLFPDVTRAAPVGGPAAGSSVGKPGEQILGTGRAPVQVRSIDEARKLPKGTPIILPDGTPGRVP